MNLLDFSYRKETVPVTDIFPQFNLDKLREEFSYDNKQNPHQLILDVTLDLWNGGYDFIFDNFGFHNQKFKKFSGHCHQITPALGVVLQNLGFETAYLESFRLDPFTQEMMSPENEQSDLKSEFCAIGRIPYCCLEITVGKKTLYLSGKHLKRENGEIKVLLTPTCYQDFIGVLEHPKDQSKSGVYLDTVVKEPFIWRKQTSFDKEVEFFKTFAHMKIRF